MTNRPAYVLARPRTAPRTTGRRQATMRRNIAFGAKLRVRTLLVVAGPASATVFFAKSYPGARTVFGMAAYDAENPMGRHLVTFDGKPRAKAAIEDTFATLKMVREIAGPTKRALLRAVCGQAGDAVVAELRATLAAEAEARAEQENGADARVIGAAL